MAGFKSWFIKLCVKSMNCVCELHEKNIQKSKDKIIVSDLVKEVVCKGVMWEAR